MINQKEAEFNFMINNKYRDNGKRKFLWDENRGVLKVGNRDFDLNLLDSFIHKKFQEEYNENLEDLGELNTKKIIKVWEKSIKDNLDFSENHEDFNVSQNCIDLLKKYIS